MEDPETDAVKLIVVEDNGDASGALGSATGVSGSLLESSEATISDCGVGEAAASALWDADDDASAAAAVMIGECRE